MENRPNSFLFLVLDGFCSSSLFSCFAVLDKPDISSRKNRDIVNMVILQNNWPIHKKVKVCVSAVYVERKGFLDQVFLASI